MTTKVLLARCRSLLWLKVRPLDRSAVPRCGPAYLITGIKPNSTPARSEITSVNNSTVPLIEISSSLGRFAGATARSNRNAPYAIPSPSAPPNMPSVTLSSSNARPICPQPAPSAA